MQPTVGSKITFVSGSPSVRSTSVGFQSRFSAAHPTILTDTSTVGDALLHLNSSRKSPRAILCSRMTHGCTLDCSIQESTLHVTYGYEGHSTPLHLMVHYFIPLHPFTCDRRCLQLFTINMATQRSVLGSVRLMRRSEPSVRMCGVLRSHVLEQYQKHNCTTFDLQPY